MAKPELNTIINLDILKPQSEPQRVPLRLMHWLLSSGRYIIVFVEVIVLAAFLVRFKFDADIASVQEEIEQKIPYIQSLKDDEALIRQTQFQIATIKNARQNSPNLDTILQRIAAQAPLGVSLDRLAVEKETDHVNLRIIGRATNDRELATFILGLKGDKTFSEVNLATVELDQGAINFSVNAASAVKGGGT